MTITNHQTLRRVCQWAFPGRFLSCTEAWDGLEDAQGYIDRAWTWVEGETPVSFAEIAAQQAAWLAARPTIDQKIADLRDVYDAQRDLTIAFLLVKLVDQLLADNTIQTTDFPVKVRQAYLSVKDQVARLTA